MFRTCYAQARAAFTPIALQALRQANPTAPQTWWSRSYVSSFKTADGKPPLRFVTATSLFDGHDASINIIRRLLQDLGAEVIHLAHNRSVDEVLSAVLQEDAQGVAISSYQGGHIEYFQYLVDLLRENGRGDVKVFGGGGGVIVPHEIQHLHKYGVERIYSPEDGQKMGLVGMIEDMIARTRTAHSNVGAQWQQEMDVLLNGKISHAELSRLLTALENRTVPEDIRNKLQTLAEQRNPSAVVLGVTGTGGAGKSSLIDELVHRFQFFNHGKRIAVIAVDPTKRKTNGALLADRLRMNSLKGPDIFMRSLATRSFIRDIPDSVPHMINACKCAGYDFILVETPGIGQRASEIVDVCDMSLYVMTPEYGAQSQLEKITMLDYANIIAVNKFDRSGALDALRDIRKQVQRNTHRFHDKLEDMPVYGTMASRFNDLGVTALYNELVRQFNAKQGAAQAKKHWHFAADIDPNLKHTSIGTIVIPPDRRFYLADIAQTVRRYHHKGEQQAQLAREIQQLRSTRRMLTEETEDKPAVGPPGAVVGIDKLIEHKVNHMDPDFKDMLNEWPQLKTDYAADELVYRVRDKEFRVGLSTKSLSGTRIPKVALPKFEDDGEIVKWLSKENLPGRFPYTGGVFPFRREGEDPTRMFAGEGDPFRTNRRFKYVSEGLPAKRLSTAFDSVTLYGVDPDKRPDIYGKIGNAGVSIATLEDMKVLYSGFDLCSETTSVSMTINGPAPIMMAMFINTAIDQAIDRFKEVNKRDPNDDEALKIRKRVLQTVRGTVQADILKEDQGQNTCIFSTDFALRMMGDIQEYFIKNKVQNFYSVSISGYHIAEAGANPISQLAFTLANGFTYVEAYLARGMKIDDFAPNLSFFFSSGMDPEYAVMGRVARRIWAITMRDRYEANPRSQVLKYHLQTSGRSLHAQEYNFNDIRTTLQALIGLYQNCNSLHTNSYDEAITTPTEESVRRALAIQMIINKEWGISMNQNPNQGSFLIEELTDLVEEAVLKEFEAISERGGVLGAMERGYQRGRIQDESLYYERKKQDGSLPIIGVNTFLGKQSVLSTPELVRSTEEEKQSQLKRLAEFHEKHASEAPAALHYLKETARLDGNMFEALMKVVRSCSLGQIGDALYEIGGQYRRNM